MKTIIARMSKEKINLLDNFIKQFEGKTGVKLNRVKADDFIMRSIKGSGFIDDLDFDFMNNRRRKKEVNVKIKL